MQRASLLLLLLAALACCAASAASPPGGPTCASTALTSKLKLAQTQLPGCEQLTDWLVLRWGIKGDTIAFGIEARLPSKTTKYLGIGLSELGSMRGADIFLLNTTASGSWQLIDAFAADFVRPVADKLQDLKALGIMHDAASGTLFAAWERHLTPCDQQDLPVTATPMHVIWAYGAASYGYHGNNRGSTIVTFSNTASSSSSSSAPVVTEAGSVGGVKVLELTYPVDIPAQTTTYRVQYFKLPSDKKRHIVGYEPIANSPLLHHGVAYSCNPAGAAAVMKLPSMGPYDRFKTDMLCEQFYMLLSGNNHSAYHAPPEAGMPMGTPSSSVIALELHYNNPEGLTGQKDKGSGIRVYYTDKLRPHDIGLITLQQPVLNIPPGKQTLQANVSVCPGSCTSRFKGPLTLLDGFFHMHGLGKSIITRRYRNGTELSPVGSLRSWDYEFQGNTPIRPEARTLQPGDTLTLQCTFDSTSRTNLTRSGVATSDEMCFHWLSYYPAQDDMGLCYSFGNKPVAVCGPSERKEVYEAFTSKDPARVTKLMDDGVLLPAADPAATSARYKEVCSPKPVV